MSRRIKRDADILLSFFNDYTLSGFCENQDRIKDCKTLHKKLYAIMVFRNETISSEQHFNIEFMDYMDEAISDLMLSVFSWGQGAYKSAKLHLRCSIENYLKSLLSITTSDVVFEKRVYLLFENADNDKHFLNPLNKLSLDNLKNSYSALCAVVHSSPTERAPINAIKYLPSYNKEHSRAFVSQFCSVLNSFLEIAFLHYHVMIHKMHPENKQDFMAALTQTAIKKITEYLY